MENLNLDATGPKLINVLDCGHVDYIDHMGSDLTIVNAAKVSFNKHSKEWDNDKHTRLLSYLATHNHWTPFSHPMITLRIAAPIPIRTQLFKHKVGFTENEISRRYVSDPPEYYFPKWRGAPTNGAKQGSSNTLEYDPVKDRIYEQAINWALNTYQYLLDNNVCPEQARMVLPQGVYTEWYWTGSLAAYARMYKQRIDSHAQWEVQQYAKAMGEIIAPLFPVSWKLLTSTELNND